MSSCYTLVNIINLHKYTNITENVEMQIFNQEVKKMWKIEVKKITNWRKEGSDDLSLRLGSFTSNQEGNPPRSHSENIITA